MNKLVSMSRYYEYQLSSALRNSDVLGFEYYQEYFSDSHDLSIGILNEQKNELVAFLPLWREENVAHCYRKSFLGECVGDVNRFIAMKEDLEDLLRTYEINAVTFRSLDFIDNNVGKIFPQARLEYEISTSIVNLNEYTIHKMRQRNLRSSQAAKLDFSRIKDWEVPEAWRMMSQFLETRQIPHLSLNRVEFLLRECKEIFEMWRVRDDSNDIQAVAFTQRFGKVLRVPNYFANRDLKGAVEVLLVNLFKEARIHGLEYVDLGISIDPITKKEVSGIVEFKRSLGAHEGRILHFKSQF